MRPGEGCGVMPRTAPSSATVQTGWDAHMHVTLPCMSATLPCMPTTLPCPPYHACPRTSPSHAVCSVRARWRRRSRSACARSSRMPRRTRRSTGRGWTGSGRTWPRSGAMAGVAGSNPTERNSCHYTTCTFPLDHRQPSCRQHANHRTLLPVPTDSLAPAHNHRQCFT